ncbi:uncharacterized protein [Linepithema humile]|uniref:uncharacterized protein n=1 Tax=Linepithema humile TaxID=83485 RepID=UPI00351E1F37
MKDHEYCESNICESYVYNQEISNEQENIAIEEKNGDAFLIELYRERLFLYNKRHNDFKDRIIKDNAWNEMSKIMLNKNYGNFYTPEYCQTRCTSLRNQYNREKRILNGQYKSGSAASTHKTFVFFSQLSFLDNYVRQRRTHSNIKAIETSSSTSSSELSVNIPKSNEVFHKISSNSEKEDNSNNEEKNKKNILKKLDTKPVKYKKRKIDETKEFEKMFSSVTQKLVNVLDNKYENEDEAFSQFIIAHLSNLPQTEKNIRKKMITDALFASLQKTSTSRLSCKCNFLIETLCYMIKHG